VICTDLRFFWMSSSRLQSIQESTMDFAPIIRQETHLWLLFQSGCEVIRARCRCRQLPYRRLHRLAPFCLSLLRWYFLNFHNLVCGFTIKPHPPISIHVCSLLRIGCIYKCVCPSSQTKYVRNRDNRTSLRIMLMFSYPNVRYRNGYVSSGSNVCLIADPHSWYLRGTPLCGRQETRKGSR
jgi:hypothetical protein